MGQGWVHCAHRIVGISAVRLVPDAGHRILIDRSLADASVHSLALTTEEEGVVLLMQSSGVGNEGDPWQYPMGKACEGAGGHGFVARVPMAGYRAQAPV
jgi:hypothetical protein